MANAYVQGQVSRYVGNLQSQLGSSGLDSTLSILRSDGGLVSALLIWALPDLTRRLEGAYTFRSAPSASDGELTEVCYELDIELAVPLPGFVKRRAESRIIQTALPELKARGFECDIGAVKNSFNRSSFMMAISWRAVAV